MDSKFNKGICIAHPSFVQTCITTHIVGDIILTLGPEISSKLLVRGQKAIRWGKNAKYSHAVLCLGNGVFVESTTSKPVLAFYYKDNDRSLAKAVDWIILRNKSVESNAELQIKLLERTMYQLGKKYNYNLTSTINILSKAKKGSSINNHKVFCSEFISAVYSCVKNEINCSLFDKNDGRITPVDLQNLSKGLCPNWYSIDPSEYVKESNNKNQPMKSTHQIMEEYAKLNVNLINQGIPFSAIKAMSSIRDLYNITNKAFKNEDIDTLKAIADVFKIDLPSESSQITSLTSVLSGKYSVVDNLKSIEKRAPHFAAEILKQQIIKGTNESFVKSEDMIEQIIADLNKSIDSLQNSMLVFSKLAKPIIQNDLFKIYSLLKSVVNLGFLIGMNESNEVLESNLSTLKTLLARYPSNNEIKHAVEIQKWIITYKPLFNVMKKAYNTCNNNEILNPTSG
jgi:methyl-accepting chemotaxis protein